MGTLSELCAETAFALVGAGSQFVRGYPSLIPVGGWFEAGFEVVFSLKRVRRHHRRLRGSGANPALSLVQG